MPLPPERSSSIPRGAILALLGFGLAGSGIELLLLEHYEDGWQFVPLMLIPAAIGVMLWHIARPTRTTVRALQGAMALLVVAGLVGVWMHYSGAAAFQLEIDPSQPGRDVVWKALRAKAPPVLAPGLLMQLGFLGLAYAYRHPVSAPADPTD